MLLADKTEPAVDPMTLMTFCWVTSALVGARRRTTRLGRAAVNIARGAPPPFCPSKGEPLSLTSPS